MNPGRALPLLVAALLALSACTASESAAPPRPATTAVPRIQSYVALGDSFTAGPYVPTTESAHGCLRSSGNYPSLVARRLHVEHFTDVSCSGASTADLTGRQHTFQGTQVPPQLRAVRPDTDLVTLGIGGNDFDLFGRLLQECTTLRLFDPTGAPCTAQLRREGFDPGRVTSRIGDRVAAAVRAVQARAPRATVLLVGYLRLAPPDGHCPQLPFARGDYAEGGRVARDLNHALAQAALKTGAGFIDMYAASRGHDVCSPHPWVNGSTTDRSAAMAYHPFAAGMAAVADRIVARLTGTAQHPASPGTGAGSQ